MFWWGNLRERDHLDDPGIDIQFPSRNLHQVWLVENASFVLAQLHNIYISRFILLVKKIKIFSLPYLCFSLHNTLTSHQLNCRIYWVAETRFSHHATI